MKKYNLLKVLGITIFVTWVLTLIIPGSSIDYSGNIVSGSISGIGIWSLFSNLNISISYFNAIAIFVIAIAIFYSILVKIEIYNNFVEKTSKLFENKNKLLVTLSIVFFGLFGMLMKDATILLVFMPFMYQVMKKIGLDKKVILSSTIVASIVGSMCGIYNDILFNMFSLKLNTLLLVKVILLVVSLAALSILVTPKKEEKEVKKSTKKTISKKETKEDKKVKVTAKEKKVNKVLYAVLTLFLGAFGINKFYAGNIKGGLISLLLCWTFVPLILSVAEFITVLTEKADKNGQISVRSKRRDNVAFGVGAVVITLFIILSTIPWESLFSNFTIFSDFNTWLSTLKIGDYTIFSNLIGEPVTVDPTYGSASGVINAFGSWTMTDISILLILVSFVIALLNKIELNEFISTVTGGIKKALPIAITAMLISLVLVLTVTSGVTTTIVNAILTLTKNFNVGTSILASIIGSLFTADFYYFASNVGVIFTILFDSTENYGVIAFIIQSIYNLVMIVAPTSVALIIGLYYLNIPYTKWLKYVWKILLVLFILIVITAVVIFALV